MGRISTLIVGLFIIGAGRAALVLKQYVPDIEGTPVDYAALVDAASMGLTGLGGIIAGYAVLAMFVSLLLRTHRARKRRKRVAEQDQQQRRQRQPAAQTQQQPSPQQDPYGQPQQPQGGRQPPGERRPQQRPE